MAGLGERERFSSVNKGGGVCLVRSDEGRCGPTVLDFFRWVGFNGGRPFGAAADSERERDRFFDRFFDDLVRGGDGAFGSGRLSSREAADPSLDLLLRDFFTGASW